MNLESHEFGNGSSSGERSSERVFFCLQQGCMENVGSWLFTNYVIILGICLAVAVIEVCCMSSALGSMNKYIYSLLRNVGVFIISDVVLLTLRKKTKQLCCHWSGTFFKRY